MRKAVVSRFTNDELRRIVEAANVPTLLMVIHQVTGDRRWLESPYRPSRTRGLSDNDDGGLPPQVLEQVQEAGVDVLRHLQSDGDWAISKPSSDLVAEMLGVCVGEPVAPMYGQMFSEELYRLTANGSGSSRTPEVPPGFSALIIGAGVSGIVAAHQLGQLGVPFTIVDAHDAPGGNWLDNPYPGAGVDTPSHLYSFSFAPYDWTRHFVLRAELQAYFASAFKTAGAAAHARFETTVESAVFDESDARWTVTLRGPDGVTDVLRPNVLVSAVGVLNRPKIPPVAGRTRFIGRQFHSSQWPADLELEGKTIAVVGTGASAMQIVPAIVDRAGSVQVVQRTPAWVAPFEKFEVPISDDARQLLQSFPLYRSWYWLKLYWQFGDKVLEALRKDPDWPFPDRAVNARNDGHRKYFTQYIRDEIGDRQDLLAQVLPDYPPYGKRILLDNGWYRALRRDHVDLVDEAVVEVGASGFVTESGEEHPVDVIVWATGFEASRFVSSYDIKGRSGQTLRDAWDDDDARAYLGITVPDFPNLFLLGGPNSFPGSGSFMYSMEVQMRYVGQLLEQMFAAGVTAVEPRRQRFEDYNDAVDAASEQTIWTHPGMQTYYRNARGRVVFVSPFRNVDYWQMVRHPTLNDYVCVVAPD